MIFFVSDCKTHTRMLINFKVSTISLSSERSRDFTKKHDNTEIPFAVKKSETVSVVVPGSNRLTQNTDFFITPLNDSLLVLPPTTKRLAAPDFFLCWTTTKLLSSIQDDILATPAYEFTGVQVTALFPMSDGEVPSRVSPDEPLCYTGRGSALLCNVDAGLITSFCKADRSTVTPIVLTLSEVPVAAG